MNDRWSTRTFDEAPLSAMSTLPVTTVARHAELVVDQHPTPVALFRRSEAQHWSADDITLDRDREQWETALPAGVRDRLRDLLFTFVIGEYTGLDQLGPMLSNSPDEDGLMFLGMQVAEEARHTHLMRRIARDVIGIEGDLRSMLMTAWETIPPAHRALATLEGRIVADLVAHPSDHRRWVRAVTLFHLVTEGMLALQGQRALVAALGRTPLLPGVRTGFSAMARDEARHVGFGLHVLRRARLDGCGDDIAEAVEQAATLAVGVQVQPGADEVSLRRAHRTGRQLAATLERRLRQIEMPEPYAAHVRAQAEAALRARIDEARSPLGLATAGEAAG